MPSDQSEIQGLRTTIYKVSDLSEAKKWYALAFREEPYFDEPFYVGFNIGGYELGLQEDIGATKGNSVISYWGVANIKHSFKYFKKIGAKQHEEPTNVGGEIMVATLYDPWDNLIGLIYNPQFKI